MPTRADTDKRRKMKKSILCCLFLLGLSAIGYCGQISRIELTDGSIIQGEIVSLDKGIYTVSTAGSSEVKVEMGKIRKIVTEETSPAVATGTSPQTANPATSPSSGDIKSEMEQAKSKIASNPAILQIIPAIILDPQFQEILKDPEIATAIKSQNIKALMENKKFLSILNNPKFRKIQEKLKRQDK